MEKKILQEVLKTALAKGGDFADIFIEKKKVLGLSWEDGRIEKVQSGSDLGAGIRVLSGEATLYAYTNDLSSEGLLKAAKTVSSGAAGGQSRDYSLELLARKPEVNFEIEKWPETIKTETKAEILQIADQSARAVSPEQIRQVTAVYSDTLQKITFANSLGEYGEEQRVRTRFLVQAVAGAKGQIQTGLESLGGFSGFELIENNSPAALAEKAAERAVNMLQAVAAPRGSLDVVMAAEAGGTMVHEACGHGLEADLVQRGLSVYAGKQGEQVASPEVTVVDDATWPGKYGSYAFDDEGVAARKVTLIKNGCLENYLYDRLTAQQDGVNSNGHGRRESYKHKPIPRMGNTLILPGKEAPEKIIASVQNGLLVQKMGGGQVNTTTGDFVFEVAEGYLIQDGKIGRLVRGATITGNGPEVLQKIELVGKDLGFSIGTCGKDGQGVPVSDAQPTLLLKGIVVGGTT